MIETAATEEISARDLADEERIDLLRSWAFIGMHAGAAASLLTGVSWAAAVACLAAVVIRLFGITAGYHRYLSHRSYRTGRVFQFVLAFLGAAAGQNGPLWWVSHHRIHHAHADTEKDVHPPGVKGLWWAHAGWIMARKYKGYDASKVKDLREYPELVWLERFHMLAPLALAVGMFALGSWLSAAHPQLGTSGLQMLGWGFFISTVLLYHITFLVNSVSHTFGSRRFETDDESRNNWWVALLTLGEGWHNNHHRAPSSERQGFYWWELDPTHYALRALSWLGLVRELRDPPESVWAEVAASGPGGGGARRGGDVGDRDPSTTGGDDGPDGRAR